MELSDRKTTVSVVMTSFNGETHIASQLESLRVQTLCPDEVLIFDDGSTDATVDIITGFIKDHKLDNWKLAVNEHNLGWKRNFIEGMRQSAGDYIFPCDQDDVWYSDKLAAMVQKMEETPEILVLAGDYHVVYEPGAIPAKIYKKTKAEATGTVSRYGFTRHFFMNPNPGCSYCVRGSFFHSIENYWFDGAPHDEFLWLMATIQDGAWFYNRTVMDYYRYAGNASSIRYKDIPGQIQNLSYIQTMLDRLSEYAQSGNCAVSPIYLKHVETAKLWCTRRMLIMKTRNPFRWLALAPLWGYYNSPMNCLSDLWLVVFGKFRR